MKVAWVLGRIAVIAFISIQTASATVLFSDNFDNYTSGAALTKNQTGPNAAPNGSGNPWFGQSAGAPSNTTTMQVVGAENGVTPHSGNNMITAQAPSSFDQAWDNIGYRLNSGNPISGGLAMDWWFYDPSGAGSSSYADYGALAYYSAEPNNTDYPVGVTLNNTPGTQIQRLSLGTDYVPPGLVSGFDDTKYQARIAGATDAATSTGWFNLPLTRSTGWHHAEVTVSPALPNGTNTVSFYIDNMTTPLLVHNSVLAFGYNTMEFNTTAPNGAGGGGATPGYFDDVTLSTFVPEPGCAVLLVLAGAGMTAHRRHRVMSRGEGRRENE